MNEIKNVEVIAEETNEVTIPEEKKEGIVKKAGKFVKTNWKKGLTLVAVGVGGFLLGAHTTCKTDEGNVEACDVIEADDYVVEDVE